MEEKLHNVVDNDDDQSPVAVAASKVHQHYFVKFYQDQKFKEEFDKAIVDLRDCDDELRRLQHDLKLKKARKDKKSHNLKYWRYGNYYKHLHEEKLRSLQEALEKMSMTSSKKPKENDDTECKDNNIHPLRKSHYRLLHHGVNNLVEEKETIKEIKEELEEAERIAEEKRLAAQKKVVYYGKYKPKTDADESPCSRRELKQKIRLEERKVGVYSMEVERVSAEYQRKARDVENIEKGLVSLESKVIRLKQQKDDLDKKISEMQRDNAEMDACYYRVIMKRALELAKEKKVEAVEELSRAGVDKFMTEWNNNAAFRKDYVRRNSDSLERRQLTKDGLSKMPKRYFYVQ